MIEKSASCYACSTPFTYSVQEGIPAQNQYYCSNTDCVATRKEQAELTKNKNYLLTDADTGTLYSGYNVGLDAVVENRGHYNRLIKEKNVIAVG